MSFASIRQAIGAVITNQSSLVQAVYLTDKSTLEGFPAVVITPSENEAEYGSTSRDKLTYVYRLKAYYPITEESNQETIDLRIEKLVDELIAIFKYRGVLLPVVDWVEPVPSSWGYETRSEAPYRTVEIVLRCIRMVDNVNVPGS